jgi:CBS domain containing-hemolysin-like protein
VSSTSAIVLTVALLLGNAFFVGAEFAVISARRSQIEPLAASGARGARTALWAMENVSLMLAAAQLGITVCSLGLGAVAEPAVAQLLAGPFEAAHVPEALIHPVAFGIGLAIVVYLHVVVGEMIPKNLALAGPERSALLLAPPLVVCARATSVLIRALRAATNLLLRAIRVEPKEELASAFTAEEVYAIVTESRREGLLGPGSDDLLTGALELSQLTAADVMVPWDRLVTVPAGSTPEDVERLIAQTGYSRFPVVVAPRAPAVSDSGYAARVIGYLHLKDLMYADDEHYTVPVPMGRVRQLVSVAGGDDIEDVLAAMQRSGSHLARVVHPDPTAGDAVLTLGVVFLEDVLEELVGEVRDATQRSGAMLSAARRSHGV